WLHCAGRTRGGATYASPIESARRGRVLNQDKAVKAHLHAMFAKFGLDQASDHNEGTQLAQGSMLGGVLTD
ncbi:MAG: hypothetical protein QOK18_4419, partial [Mycobacterium sp.]|nr:hypothetical protein [Mycobacterium sp.]